MRDCHNDYFRSQQMIDLLDAFCKCCLHKDELCLNCEVAEPEEWEDSGTTSDEDEDEGR